MKNERDIGNEMQQVEDELVDKICHLLENYTTTLTNHLISIVSRLCNVPSEDLFTNTKNLDVVRARWLFWYAYRYMTDATFEGIATCKEQENRFTRAAVSQGYSKMYMMVSEENSIWAKRWSIIRRIINQILKDKGDVQQMPKTITLQVKHPKGIKVEIKNDDI